MLDTLYDSRIQQAFDKMAQRCPNRPILIVDDDPDTRGLVTLILECEGHLVRCASNGKEALEQLAHGEAPRVILLDLMMPVMNGAEFMAARAGDAALSAIPVVLLSGDPLLAERARTLGVDRYLSKPITLEALLQVVSQY